MWFKRTVNSKKLYEDFNKALNSYKKLNPEKYTSLEMICYVDLMQDKLIPFVEDLNISQSINLNRDLILQNAHALWLAALENGVIDKFCQPTGRAGLL